MDYQSIYNRNFKKFKGSFTTDYNSINADGADAAIIATPNDTHYQIASTLLAKGISVLIEKPVVLSGSTYHRLKENQRENKAIMQSGMVKRHLPINRVIGDCFQQKALGGLRSFEISEGMNFNWPIRSLGFFDKAKAGGGVLIDNGIHVLDLIFWWLQKEEQIPEISHLNYQDDSQGGVEAECKVNLTFDNGLKGSLHFSRMRILSQTWQLNFEKGQICFSDGRLSLSVPKEYENHNSIRQLKATRKQNLKTAFNQQLATFYEKNQEKIPEDDPVIPYTLDLINRLYANRETQRTSYYQFKI